MISVGGSGIGAATAVNMANKGWHPVLIDANESGLAEVASQIANSSIRGDCYVADVTDNQALNNLANKIESDNGPVEALVTPDGIINNSQTILEMDVKEHDRVCDVNYFGTIHTIRAFAQ